MVANLMKTFIYNYYDVPYISIEIYAKNKHTAKIIKKKIKFVPCLNLGHVS